MNEAKRIRAHLVQALEADLIGPYELDKPQAEELLSLPPMRWYLTGFLAPEARRVDDLEGLEDEELAIGSEETSDDAGDNEPENKFRKLFPASIGLSVFLPGRDNCHLKATVTYADYAVVEVPETKPDGSLKQRKLWQRFPRGPVTISVPLDEAKLHSGIDVPQSNGLKLIGKLATADAPGLPQDCAALSLFLVNRREHKESTANNEQCVFQVSLELQCDEGFVPRTNTQGETSTEWDEQVAELQFREKKEYAVGHGISFKVGDGSPPTSISTCWLPSAEVRRVLTHDEPGVVVSMDELSKLKTAQDIDPALSRIPLAYAEWLDGQERIAVDGNSRTETRNQLVKKGREAQRRIADGIALLKENPNALRAFRWTNEVMAEAARQRSPENYEKEVPKWRLFQLAFILLNVRGIVDGTHIDRKTVELIFFPTGGGKTEAYLGVIAFTLLMRRLSGRERPDGGLGVAVLLRYTLRLLTLDQLSRASTLICALERLRVVHSKDLGDVRFSIGLWVGKSATANTLKEVGSKIEAYRNRLGASPFPLESCPWCRTPIEPHSLALMPSLKKPEEVLVGCVNTECLFSPQKTKEGLPVLFVDEQIYRELPSFLVSTVDKFAMLPLRGETGMLFGRAKSRKGKIFFGPMDKEKGSVNLPKGLLPPELIVQDELHLISGPLGTMVGLYETAIEMLCTQTVNQKQIPPKILAATATVRRAQQQIRALFGRTDMALFPPPGVNESDSYFAKVDTSESPGRLYVGVAASGRALKAILIRVYTSLLASANKQWQPKGSPEQPADAYMSLVGYFNSLRELGGMRRLAEDDVRKRTAQAENRRPEGIPDNRWYRDRPNLKEPIELTSRETTAKISTYRARLAGSFSNKAENVDVALASNMISVGIDIARLGLMVVAGQPKTTSEYIQASSRVGRAAKWPGLVVTCFNLHKPRDRSHYERFATYHESFYRFVEAMSLTPFSGPALARGLAGTFVSMARLNDAKNTPPLMAMEVPEDDAAVQSAIEALKRRAGVQAANDGDDAGELAENVRKLAQDINDAWSVIAKESNESGGERTYSRLDKEKKGRPLLRTVLDESTEPPSSNEEKFVAPTSMREVEPVVHLWLEKRSREKK